MAPERETFFDGIISSAIDVFRLYQKAYQKPSYKFSKTYNSKTFIYFVLKIKSMYGIPLDSFDFDFISEKFYG